MRVVPCEFCDKWFDPTVTGASCSDIAYICPESVPSKRGDKWDNRFLEMAALISTWSKDRSTKCGAVVVDDVRNVRSIGYNGFPRQLNDDIDERHDRPMKYFLTAHAEQNAVFAAARHGASLENCTIYCNRSPCAECAKAIIQSGIKRAVYPFGADKPTGGLDETFVIALEMLKESGVEVRTC